MFWILVRAMPGDSEVLECQLNQVLDGLTLTCKSVQFRCDLAIRFGERCDMRDVMRAFYRKKPIVY
jgi:hypothetical protein